VGRKRLIVWIGAEEKGGGGKKKKGKSPEISFSREKKRKGEGKKGRNRVQKGGGDRQHYGNKPLIISLKGGGNDPAFFIPLGEKKGRTEAHI